MFDRGAAAPDTAEDEGFESADEGQSDHQPSNFIRPDSRSNSFSDVSLASEGRSSSPVRPLSRLSRQSLAEHHAATNGHIPAAAQAIPSWSRNMEQYQQQNAAGSLEESIPEMLRIKDLDSGKEYNLDKASFAAALMHSFCGVVAFLPWCTCTWAAHTHCSSILPYAAKFYCILVLRAQGGRSWCCALFNKHSSAFAHINNSVLACSMRPCRGTPSET